MKSNQVVIVQRRLTHYRVPLFEGLRDALGKRGVQLRVLVGEGTKKERSKQDAGVLSWAVQMPTRYWFSSKICWQPIFQYIRSADLVIVTQESSQIASQLLVLFPFGKKVAFWGHGANFQSTNPTGIRERYKAWVSRRVNWWFAYTSLSAEAVRKTGFDPKRITVLNNSVEVECKQGLKGSALQSEKIALLGSLGLRGGLVGIFVGSFYSEKRLEFLFLGLDAIKSRLEKFEFIFVGDGPDRNSVREFCEHRSWVIWVGRKVEREKYLHLSIASIILSPGSVGLGILDSFAMGVPMVTTACGNHGPEIAYLEDNENGVMTANDLKSFVDGAVRILSEEEEWARLSRGALRSAISYTLENMIERFADGIDKAVDVVNGTGKTPVFVIDEDSAGP